MEILRSSVKPSLKQHFLWRGSLLGLFGIILILFGGTFLKVHTLSIWGLPLLAGGFLLITWGLLPYRKLTILEIKPHLLELHPNFFLLTMHGKPRVSVPWSRVEKAEFVENASRYGIAIWLKNQGEKTIVYDPKITFDKEGYLFLPYFSERAYREFIDFYTPD